MITRMDSNVEIPTSLHDKTHDGAKPLSWLALQVRSRYESTVAEHLSGNGYERFLPFYKCRKRWSDRVKEVDAPLFPGYLFCRFDPKNGLPILKIPGVIQIVGCNGTPLPIDDGEIDAIQRFITSGIPSQPWPFLRVGDRVRIESGPLCGVEGILIEFKGNHRLIVSVTLLQRSVAVSIDSALVSSLRPSREASQTSTDLQPRPLHLLG
jgi:transcription antitermination factor NusG